MTETLLNQIDKLNEYLHLESEVNKKDFKYINTMLQSMRNEAINYSQCCTQLKDKNELTFDEWCEVNKYTKTKNGKYVDTQDLWFTEKALLKIYNLDIDL